MRADAHRTSSAPARRCSRCFTRSARRTLQWCGPRRRERARQRYRHAARDSRRRLAYRRRADAGRARGLAAHPGRDDGRTARRPAPALRPPAARGRLRAARPCRDRRCADDARRQRRLAMRRHLLQQRDVPRHVRPRPHRPRDDAGAHGPVVARHHAVRYAGGHGVGGAERRRDGDDRERRVAAARARRRGRRAGRGAA